MTSEYDLLHNDVYCMNQNENRLQISVRDVTVIQNWLGDSFSKPGLGCLQFTQAKTLGKGKWISILYLKTYQR